LANVFEQIAGAFGIIFTFEALLVIVIASLIALVVGIIPGLGGNVAMALLIPFIWGMKPEVGIIFLLTLHTAVTFGGSVTAILFNTPGTGQNVATCFDGYPLTQQGKAEYALGASAASCALGACFGALFLAFAIPIMRPIVLLFGPAEFFVLTLMGIATIAVVSRGSTIKGLIAGGLGLILSFVGEEQSIGALRYTFGSLYLWDGVERLIVVIGFFAFGEMIRLLIKGGSIAKGSTLGEEAEDLHLKGFSVMDGVKATWLYRWLVLRSSLLGTAIGMIPGVGGSVANFIAYSQAKATSKNPELFGNGSIEGVIGPEASNDAKEGGALIPTLVFGIPGSSAMAILLMGLLYMDITPGKDLITNELDLVFALVLTIAVSNIFISAIGVYIAPKISKVSFLPVGLIIPFIFAMGSLGVFVVRRSLYDVLFVFIMGVLGYFMSKHGFLKAPLIIGLILGELVERYFNLSVELYGPLFIFQKPLAMGIVIAVVLSLVATSLNTARKKKQGGAAA